jgi:hypothetical protein
MYGYAETEKVLFATGNLPYLYAKQNCSFARLPYVPHRSFTIAKTG